MELTIFSRPDGARRGDCPTLDAPMQTGDGLLARMRVAGNRLTPQQLAAIARLARQHGNGLVEVTARGNLQIRGLTPASVPRFAEAASSLVTIETGLVVDISPIAGEDPEEKADPRPLAAGIRTAAASVTGKLGPKVSVVIDGNGQLSLAAVKADIRLVALDAARWSVMLGQGKPQIMDTESAVAAAIAVLNALAALGAEARAADLFPPASTTASAPAPRGWNGGNLVLSDGHANPIALPFGQMHANALIELAIHAEACRVRTIRLAPGHAILLDNAPDVLIDRAATLGFITSPTDPRRHISACIGSDGCASGHIAARRLAAQLAPHLPSGRRLHVSGCAKGCAHPRPADLTLVGRADGIGLVIDGRAGDTPRQVVDEAGLLPALAARQEIR
ncbi:precorrin-3B synthase [Devosia sp. YIM 151766]|uniref:precorrin-3B synthase n=1 Tax=Devosia sp. YIM 151766 TaxID=3017325 RepID=UPI00255C6F60|nr:precorrin-3B synthase [Devosia sp. YIM 151766]WIY54457.1 precorrin-3B synthase [Devosia sp. YIM 151766]